MIRLKFWLLCISIALNVFFVGAYMADKLPWSTDSGATQAPAMPYEALDLSSQQRALFEAERNRFHSQLMEIRQSIYSKHEKLIRLLSVEKPDRAAISAQQEEILSLQGRLQNDVIAHLLDVSAPLSQIQRERFFSMLKERMTPQGTLSPYVCN